MHVDTSHSGMDYRCPAVLHHILQETAHLVRGLVVEWHAEHTIQHTAYVPGARPLGIDRPSLVAESEVQTNHILRIIGIAQVAGHIVLVYLSIVVQIHIHSITKEVQARFIAKATPTFSPSYLQISDIQGNAGKNEQQFQCSELNRAFLISQISKRNSLESVHCDYNQHHPHIPRMLSISQETCYGMQKRKTND